MDRIVRHDIPFSLNLDALKASLGVDEDYEDEFLALYEECVKIANPKYMLLTCPVRVEGEITRVGAEAFDSRIMSVNMKDVSVAYPYAVTCGRELYEFALSKNDPLERYWIDSIAEQILYRAGALAFEEAVKIAGSENLSSMNPGSLSDFPITNQKPLFRLLSGAREEIGLELTESCLMLPYKSLSGIYFVSEEHFVNCALCQRANCPNRRAEFDEMLFNTRYALA